MSFAEVNELVDRILEQVDGDIVLALPLGLGKPVALVDALYRRIAEQQQRSLTILTALSLERPVEHDPIPARLLNPVFDRLYANYTEPQYLRDERQGCLPSNITIKEFYFKPGSRLGHEQAQRHYISSNYTFDPRDVAAQGCNVVMQLLADDSDGADTLSMSCNPDTSLELVNILREQQKPVMHIGVIHPDLPYMYGDAEIAAEAFDYVLRERVPSQHGLFSVPYLAPISAADYAIGVHVSTLIADGGTLQLGIGAMGDAIVQALLLRHQQPNKYRQLLSRFELLERYGSVIAESGGIQPFHEGLYGATEMFVEGFFHLFTAGILKREVYDFWALQQLVNDKKCNPLSLSAQNVIDMAEAGVRELRGKDFDTLQYHGFFNDETQYSEGHLISPFGERFSANLANPDSQKKIVASCLGANLRNGKVLHGGFFLGNAKFYQALVDLPALERQKLAMSGVDKINQLDVNPRLFKAQRQRARFINTGLNVSLNGAVASDTLENGQVVSGVGGQYNFVAMAHQLPGGRSILMIRASRNQGKNTVSNVLWHYASCTIPRHLRDIVVTEYGIADLRSKSDEEVIKALIKIADSRFQSELMTQAKEAGKLDKNWHLPQEYKNNLPATIQALVGEVGQCLPAYPFGCDFTELELESARALQQVAGMSVSQKLRAVIFSRTKASGRQSDKILDRLDLLKPQSLKSRLLAKLLSSVLAN